MPERPPDPTLESSTLRWMRSGVVLIALFVLAFPVYRLYEPAARAAAREEQRESLIDQGERLWSQSCAACHGAIGEGIDAPALNSRQFLSAVTDEQIESLAAHGIPGSEMSAWSLDFGGPLTSQQIAAITTFIRAWEGDAPDRPDWRNPTPPPGAGHHEDEEADDAHGEEPAEEPHDEEPPDEH